MIQPLFLGVDGGGTRCRARLETLDGRILGSGLSGPASMRFGFEAARESIMAAVRQILQQAALSESVLKTIHAGIGLAGTGQLGAREQLESWKHPFASVVFEGDGYLAYVGAFGGGDGGIVIAGTGSIAITYLNGKTVRIGGYGFPVSDEGSGADLGLNALRHALYTLDGRAAPTAFSKEIMAKFSGNYAVLIEWMEKANATDYATLAPLVVQHARKGNPAAVQLMQQAGLHIAGLIEGLVKRGVARVALVGGFAAAVKAYLPETVAMRLVAPQADAMAGGILLAKQKYQSLQGPTAKA